jgi:hypothetical protein
MGLLLQKTPDAAAAASLSYLYKRRERGRMDGWMREVTEKVHYKSTTSMYLDIGSRNSTRPPTLHMLTPRFFMGIQNQ